MFCQFDIITNNQLSVLDSFFQILSMAKPSIFQKNWQFNIFGFFPMTPNGYIIWGKKKQQKWTMDITKYAK